MRLIIVIVTHYYSYTTISIFSQMQNLVTEAEGKKLPKRDALREIEIKMQEKWEKEKIFEIDAPKV